MLLDFAPVSDRSIDISNSEALLGIIWDLLKHELKPIKGLIGLSEDEIDIGHIIKALDIFGVDRQYFLVNLLGSQKLFLLIVAHGDILQNFKIIFLGLGNSFFKVSQRIWVISFPKAGLPKHLENL